MRIVVLDDIGIGAEDLRRLEQKGDVRVFSGSPRGLDEVVERARGAEVVISGWTKIDRRVLAALPGLQLVSLWATGLDNVDLAAAHKQGVIVSHVPSYAANAVAELALGLMLAVLRKIPAADQHLRRSGQPEWQPFQGGELHGRTLGVVGTGVIGQRVARLGRCLGMSLLGYDLQPSQTVVHELGMRYVTLSQLFEGSDVVTLHAPLTPDTLGLVDGAVLSRLPETAIIINTARAGLISQDDLLEVCREKSIAGAGLDVIDLSLESGAELLALDNVVATPHIGFYTREALANLTKVCVDNVVGFLDGAPANVAGLPPAPSDPKHAGAGVPNEEEISGI
jgi:phosphoglycerate dehydrogenase-like enzyme